MNALEHLKKALYFLPVLFHLLSTCIPGLIFPAYADNDTEWNIPFPLHGFLELAAALRYGDSRTTHEDYNLLEGKFQLKFAYYPEKVSFLKKWNSSIFFKGEVAADWFEEEPDGELRECYLGTSPFTFLDLKLGRQVITWGTGDLIFINDLFPKDWVSFFIGRDDEYLKSPSDALRMGFFSRLANVDLIFIPRYEPDNPIRGKRLSFFNPFTGTITGEDTDIYYHRPDRNPKYPEYALRLNRFLKSYETALYGFWGYYKQPVGVKPTPGKTLFYPRLHSYGASIRGPAASGIIHMEIGYYISQDDESGSDPLVENSSMRYLIGYEREWWTDFIGGCQYFLNQLLDYGDYRASTPTDTPRKDHYYHLVTFRATQLLYHQDVELSFFAFYSPSDQDFHLRPRISYELSDHWKITLGANLFGGRDNFTMFGQLKGNDNLYVRVRYSF